MLPPRPPPLQRNHPCLSPTYTRSVCLKADLNFCVRPSGGRLRIANRGNYYYDLSLRPRKTQRVNSTTPRSRRFLKSFPIFSNLRHVFRRLCPIRGPFIALRQCRRRVNSTTPRSRFLQRLPNLQQCRRWSKHSDFVFKTTMGFSPTLY